MTYKSHIPNLLTLIRIIFAPIFIYTFLNDLYFVSVMIIIIAGLTDVLDGHIARKIDKTSDKGAYLDVTADFILILSCFCSFILKDWYDPIILLLIIIMFFLFITTSGLKKPVYDPVGKYLGGYLMLMIFISLLLPEIEIRIILTILLATICIISMISRFTVFLRENIS